MILGSNCIHLREYTKEELEEKLMIVGFREITIKGIWLGLRGKFELGISSKETRKIFTGLASKSQK
jgi:hypothetical protein